MNANAELKAHDLLKEIVEKFQIQKIILNKEYLK